MNNYVFDAVRRTGALASKLRDGIDEVAGLPAVFTIVDEHDPPRETAAATAAIPQASDVMQLALKSSPCQEKSMADSGLCEPTSWRRKPTSEGPSDD